MKSCTDLNQSRMLAKILRLESADMYYHPYPNDEDWYDVPNIGNADLRYNQLPCWSLAALLEFLHPNVTLDHTEGEGWEIRSYYVIEKPNSILQDVECVSGFSEDNPIDACVEMIVKLKELKLL